MRDEHTRSLDSIERASKCFDIINLFESHHKTMRHISDDCFTVMIIQVDFHSGHRDGLEACATREAGMYHSLQ